MKWLLVLVSFTNLSLFATPKWGSECGLTDDKNDEAWIQVGRTLDLRKASPDKLQALPTLTKQQIIITAKDEAKDRGDDASSIKDTEQAAEYLKANSESQDIQVANFKVKKLKVTLVSFWPGGNPYAHIFLYGTRHVIAFNQDDTIACK